MVPVALVTVLKVSSQEMILQRIHWHIPAGVISMARAMDPDSAGSQFFIMHKNAPHLDGQYAAFGKITEGMDIVDKIATCETDWSDAPMTPVVMKTVTVDTFGETYPEPEKC